MRQHGAATRFEHVTEIAVAVALVGALVAALACVYGRLLPLALAASLVLLLAPTLAGHAARAAGGRPISVAVDLVHVGAAAFWIGGLLQLALLLRRGYDERVVRRFSSLALVAVALIALTGLGRAVVELNAVSQLWSTGYGRTIVLKSVLLVGLVLLGWLSRRGIDARQSLLRTVTAELVVLALVVGAVGVLTALRPGRDAATPPRPQWACARSPTPRRRPGGPSSSPARRASSRSRSPSAPARRSG